MPRRIKDSGNCDMSDLFMTFHITLKMYIVKYLLDFEDKRKNIFTVKKKIIT
jgi:hypothetical protein